MKPGLALLILLSLAAGEGTAAPSSAQRGRDLFMGYQSWANGDQATRNGLPHPFNACGHCHGPTGEGLREGDVQAPPLTRQALLNPADGKPAYANPGAVFRAITQGQGRDGRLGPAMPLFRLTQRDRRDLGAYLRILGSVADQPPGVTGEAIRVATRLPDDRAGTAMLKGLRLGVEATNRRGGIHGRRLELKSFSSQAALTEITAYRPFLLLGGSTSASDEAWSASNRIPHLAALAPTERPARLAQTWTAPLFAGQRAENQFMDAARRQGSDPWLSLGLLAGRILAEALAQAGPRLHERAILEALPALNGMEISPGLTLAFRADQLYALDFDAATPHYDLPLNATPEERP